MKIKVCFNNETHRISKLPENLQTLTQLISSIFLTTLPKNWGLEYIDSDGDKIMLADDQDYKEFVDSQLEVSQSSSAAKVYIVPRDLNESCQIRSVEEIMDNSADKQEEGYQIIESPAEEPLEKETTDQQNVTSEEKNEEVETPKGDLLLDETREEEASQPIEPISETPKEEPVEKENPKEHVETAEKSQNMPEPVEVKPKSETKAAPAQKAKSAAKVQTHKKAPPKPPKKVLKAVISDQDLERLVTKAVEKNLEKIASMTQAHLAKKEGQSQVVNPPKVQEKVIHRGITCDGCEKYPLEGIRYKCSVCHDFDFCETCEQTKEHEHAFIKIKAPRQPFSHYSSRPFQPNMGFPPMMPPPLHFMPPPPNHFMPPQPNPFMMPPPPPMFPQGRNLPNFGCTFLRNPEDDQDRLRDFFSKFQVPREPEVVPESQQEDVAPPKVAEVEIQDETNVKVEEQPQKEVIEEVKKEVVEEVKKEVVEEAQEKKEEAPVLVPKKKKVSFDLSNNNIWEKPLLKKKSKYSKNVQQKAKVLSEIFPGRDLESLLTFIADAPDDLDLNELAENFRL